MRILFYDAAGMEYHALSVESMPLGGAESAACYLSRSLARQGHDVVLMSGHDAPAMCDGVWCVPHPFGREVPWSQVDAVVWMGPPADVHEVRRLAPRAPVVLWVPHAANQPWVQYLNKPAGWQPFDALVMVSEWQRREFVRTFGIPVERTHVLRNGVGFPFEEQFREGEAIVAAKARPPVLAYTSAPFRGLDVLLHAFPLIRKAVPGARLKVFSGMRVYQTPVEEEARHFGQLYQRCMGTDGVEYVGAVSQPELAVALKHASVLSYPNTFSETSCIAVMEAMASGCRVVTSDLAALPETTAGFARLVKPVKSRDAYVQAFVEQTIAALKEFLNPDDAMERSLNEQVQWTVQHASWRVRAREWTQWFGRMARPLPQP